MTPTIAPYGSWESPISIETLARSGTVWYRFQSVDIAPDGVYWLEVRPAEKGRNALVFLSRDGEREDVVPAEFNVRTRVHEYGGGAYWRHRETLFCSSFEDGRVYRVERRGVDPVPVTPEPAEPSALRYADGVLTNDGQLVVCVRERHEGDEVTNELVAFPADGSGDPRVVVSGNDFYSSPRVSPDGATLAWTTWNHPLMPFEGCELWKAPLEADGTVGDATLVAGGPLESICQPRWSPDGALYFCSDRTGWWNLYRDGEPVAPTDAEIGYPQWLFGFSSYDFLEDGRIACVAIREGIDTLAVVDPARGTVEDLGLPYTAALPHLHAEGNRFVLVASGPSDPPSVIEVDATSREARVLARSTEPFLDEESISPAEPVAFPGADGETAHAFVYRPRNARYAAPEGELPPLRVVVHGGPTSRSPAALTPDFQFWTSRGFAVLDVNYGGSTGYGRAYRDRLKRRWGEVDVEDCIAGARYLADQGIVDRERMSISGGSAGGYTTLCALAWHDVFAAGISVFGVTDLVRFREVTHKFEENYDQYLVGPWPEAEAVYRERSPINAADRIRAPLLVLQGLDDEIVPPSQAEEMVAALDANGVPYAYLAFEGEGHGFRREDSIRRALSATLYFLARVFGFEPADEVEPVEIANLGALTR